LFARVLAYARSVASIDPLMLDVPESFETERLVIRAPRPGDGVVWYAAMLASVDDSSPWTTWQKEIGNLEAAEKRLRENRVKWAQRAEFHVLVFEKAGGAFVGGNGLHHVDWRVPKFEIGYWTVPALAKKGYATEATRAMAALAFDVLKAKRVQIRCEPGNVRSRRVAERAGFVQEATLKNDIPPLNEGEEARDAIVYAMTR
jgi:RimJ/RimL family protein N-acetyltransferase